MSYHWQSITEYPELPKQHIHLWFIDMAARPVGLLDTDYATLSQDEKVRADRFHFPHHRARYVTCRSALRRLLKHYAAAEQLNIMTNAYGKPMLEQSDVCFNLSHSEDFALLGVCRDTAIGVDIEYHRHNVDYLGVASSIMSTDDFTAFSALPVEQRKAAFYRAWTRKEATIKCLGLGFSYDVKNCKVNFTNEQAQPSLDHLEGYTARDFQLSEPPPCDSNAHSCVVSRTQCLCEESYFIFPMKIA